MTNLCLNFNLVCQFLSPFYSEHSLSEIRNRLTPICSIPWKSVIDIANNFLVTPALWSSLKAKGVGAVVEKKPRDYLCRLYGLNKRRNTHLRRQLLNAIGVLNSAGISPLLAERCRPIGPAYSRGHRQPAHDRPGYLDSAGAAFYRHRSP